MSMGLTTEVNSGVALQITRCFPRRYRIREITSSLLELRRYVPNTDEFCYAHAVLVTSTTRQHPRPVIFSYVPNPNELRLEHTP